MQNKSWDLFFIIIIYSFTNVPSVAPKGNVSQVSRSHSLHNAPIKTE